MWRNNERKDENSRGSEIKDRGKVRGEEGKDGWMDADLQRESS